MWLASKKSQFFHRFFIKSFHYFEVKLLSHVQLLRPHGLQLTRLLCPWNFPGKSTGVGCHFLLQGIFPSQGSNRGLPHCRQMLYCPSCFPVAQLVKNLPAMQETWVPSLGWEDPLECSGLENSTDSLRVAKSRA